MRILLISHYYAPEFGAPQRRWSALVRRFIAAGHQVTVMTPVPHYPAGRPTADQAQCHHVGGTETGMHGETIVRTHYLAHRGDIVTRSADHALAAIDGLRRSLLRFRRRSARPDVIIATAPAIDSLFAGTILSRLWRVPLVVEMRDAWPDLVTHVGAAVRHERVSGGEDPPAPDPARPPRRSLPRQAIGVVKAQVHLLVSAWQRDAAQVVTTTSRFAGVLRKRGIARVDVVRNGADLNVVQPQRDHVPAHEELRCLYLGNMGRSQGLETVVRAAARVHAEGVPIRVRLVGHGAERERLDGLARELGAPVEVHPRIPYSEVGEQYAWADTVLVSLRSWEPFTWTVPSKLYELLATGRHVTALVAGESADVVRASGAGDVIQPEDVDALVDLWRDLQADRERVAVRASGRNWVREHASDDVLARRYLEILTEVREG
ncbi:glycosyltransferase family 4 protein [Brachybacterium kimchii]|uniref:D-inositol 3-phosphate glycosyltransferase n=1 Tax=Brachybacterium kimchii TaxID=2942909 RepID=A0ABY4N0R0_9MICO|nr:glycosyltransferase family 4 protein [Brachybacterium kimchii]UQN28101.1 glycosyltransferase family 4 protein [Brachybacterium kimchii]